MIIGMHRSPMSFRCRQIARRIDRKNTSMTTSHPSSASTRWKIRKLDHHVWSMFKMQCDYRLIVYGFELSRPAGRETTSNEDWFEPIQQNAISYVSYHTIPCYIVCVIPFNTMLYRTCRTIQYHAISYMSYHSIPYQITIPGRYRITQTPTQIFFVSEAVVHDGEGHADMIEKRYLQRVMSVQRAIEQASIISEVDGQPVSLDSLCFRPIEGESCLVESPSQYWLGDPVLLAGDDSPSLTTACQTTDEFLSSRSPCMDQVKQPLTLMFPLETLLSMKRNFLCNGWIKCYRSEVYGTRSFEGIWTHRNIPFSESFVIHLCVVQLRFVELPARKRLPVM